MAAKKRNDRPAKIDAEVLRVAASVAALRGITVAEYLSERLRPLVFEDHAEEVRKMGAQAAQPAAEPRAGKRRRED
jgi:hypothetical protein